MYFEVYINAKLVAEKYRGQYMNVGRVSICFTSCNTKVYKILLYFAIKHNISSCANQIPHSKVCLIIGSEESIELSRVKSRVGG